MKNIIFLFASFLLLASCYTTESKSKRTEPSNLIEQDTMVLLIADIEIAESVLRQKQNTNQQIGSTDEAYYHTIFSKYDVSRGQFDSSMAWYKQEPEMTDKIYEEVITRLSVIESEIQMEEEEIPEENPN